MAIAVVDLSSLPSSSSSSSLHSVPGLDQTDHSELTAASHVTAESSSDENTQEEKTTASYHVVTQCNACNENDHNDDSSLDFFGDDNDDDDDDDMHDTGTSKKVKVIVNQLHSSWPRSVVQQQRHCQKQQKSKKQQRRLQSHMSFNDSQVSFSSRLTEIIEIVPPLSPNSKGRCFYSGEELSEFRVEYEFELEGLLPAITYDL
jgi:hypothetical protein